MPTDESDGVIGDALQSLFEAVAERTHASERDITGGGTGHGWPDVIRTSNGRPSSTRLLGAAAAVLILLATAAVLVTRSASTDSGGVTIGGSTPNSNPLETDDVPRIAPSRLPEGWVLDTVRVGRMTPVRIGWRAEWATPADPATGLRQRVTVLVSPAAIADLEQPLETNPRAGNTADVNGAQARVNRYVRPGDGGAANSPGSVVTWTVPRGTRLSVSADGATDDNALAVARAAQLDEHTTPERPTATIDPVTIPSGAEKLYEGPNYGGEFRRTGNGPGDDQVAGTTLNFRRLAPARSGSQVDLSVNVLSIGTVDPQLWLESRLIGPVLPAAGERLDMVSVSRNTAAAPPSDPYALSLAGPGFAIELQAQGWADDELTNLVSGLRRYAPDEWAAYLSSAETTPYPARQVAPEDVPLCDGLAAATDAWREERRISGGSAFESSGEDLRPLAKDAPADMASALVVLADYQENRRRDLLSQQTGGSAPRRSWEHEDVVRLKGAARTVETWSRSRCSRFVSVSELGVVTISLDAQNERFNPFCRAWQNLQRAANGSGDGSGTIPEPPASFRALVPQLDAALALAPTDATDLIEGIRHRRELWLATSDGDRPATASNDPDGYLVQVTNTHCPDWPM